MLLKFCFDTVLNSATINIWYYPKSVITVIESPHSDFYKETRIYTFNENNIIEYSGISTTDGKEYKTDYTYLWKLENGVYYKIMYNNPFGYWNAFSIKYIDENTIKIGSYEYTRNQD